MCTILYKNFKSYLFKEVCGFVVVGVVLFLGFLTRYNLRDNLHAVSKHPDSFNVNRAWNDLKSLTSFGSRPTGSYANEILAVEFLKREIAGISREAHRNQVIELDVQVVSGAFWTDFKPFGMTSVYRNVQNVVVKLHGDIQPSTNSSLMLNCHFDSVPGSPGASDDGLHCIVMLEILRTLSQSKNRNKHSIIFLFNGAEETGLQASHGFITQHIWAKNIKAFINLESAGSAGKELLFQSSSANSYLIKLFGKSVPYPNAQVAGEEIFQSGIIPSDTDFRIFSKFGRIPGLDFAHFINGYRYHTKFDHIDYLSEEVLQHTGINIFELTKAISNSDELNTNSNSDGDSQVFFDVLGMFFVSYSLHFSKIFNYSVIICTLLVPYMVLSHSIKGIDLKSFRVEVFFGVIINPINLIVSNALCYAIAFDIDLQGKSMSWYSNTFICIPLYCVMTVLVQCIINLILHRSSKTNLTPALQSQARLLGTSIFWCLLAGTLTAFSIRTAYALIVPVLITLISNSVIGLCGYENTTCKWIYVHLLGQVLVVLWTTNFYNMVLDMFIPIAGRSGGSKNPDIMIGIMCCCLAFFVTSYITPLVILLKKWKIFLIGMFASFVITRFFFIGFTNYGFPYTDESLGAPKVQRHYITHTIRTLYDKEGHIRYTDSGYYMLDLDRNARKTIESLTMPEEPLPQNENILCITEVFCGLPLISARFLMLGGFWIPGPAPLIRDVGNLKLIDHIKTGNSTHQLRFILTGSYLMALHIRLKDAVHLENWSLLQTVPPNTIYNNQNGYFVMITNGLEADPLNITMHLKTYEEHKRSLLDVTLVTLHFEYHKEHTSTFTNILAKFPRWTYVVPSVASLSSWTF